MSIMYDNTKRIQYFTRNAVFLTQLKELKSLKNRGFMTFDIETKDGLIAKKVFCWSLAYKINKTICVLSERNDKTNESCSFNKLFEFLAQKSIDKFHKRIIFVQNLYFEARHLIEFCVLHKYEYFVCNSGSQMLSFIINEFNVKFLDSQQFLQSSQDVAEIDYNINENYRKIDCKELFNLNFKKWSKSDKEKVFQHNINDAKALLEIMSEYRKIIYENAGLDMLNSVSLATLALRSFRVTLKQKLQNPFITLFYDLEHKRFTYKYQKFEEQFVRKSYFGGRNEVFNLNLLEKGIYIDRVSMYPSSMKFHKYPIGIGIWENDREKLMNIIKGKTEIEGFIECEIKPTKLKYPILPERIKNRILFTNCYRKNVYTIPELKFAFKKGYKIKPKIGFLFEQSDYIFTDFVDKFFKIKSESKGGKRKTAKILLNSCYGKFGEAFERKSVKMHYFLTQKEQIEFLQSNENLNIVKNVKNNENEIYISIESIDSTIIKSHMNVCIASYVTAYSRLALYEQLEFCEKHNIEVFYVDTDSFTTSNEILKVFKPSKELGGWDIENEFRFVKFLAPKCYIFDCLNSKTQKYEYKIKMKGIPKSKLEEIEKIAEKYYESEENDLELRKRGMKFIELMLRQPIQIAERYMTFKESHRSGAIIGSKILTKHYTMSNLKREFLINGTSNSWNDSNLPIEFRN